GHTVCMRAHRLTRSFLYVPGDRHDRLDKALDRGADALIVDLEDSVAVDRKAAARSIAAAWLSSQDTRPCQLWVRVNANALAEDIAAVVDAGVDGIVLPKAEPELVETADGILSELAGRSADAETLGFIALVESGRGLLAAPELAAAPRVARLGLGEADLLADLRIRP